MDLKLGYLRSVALGALAGGLFLSGAALAAPVTLTVHDGSVVISGDLVSYEDNFYVIETSLGSMRIASSRVSCDGEGCPAPAEAEGVLIAGSDTVGDGLVPLLLTGFAAAAGGIVETEQTDGMEITSLIADEGFGDSMGVYSVSATTSGDAFTKLADGTAQIGMSSRRIRPAEARRLASVGGGNMISAEQEHIIAVDSLVVIVNQANPISQISLAQLDGIYSGRITNWADLGGRDEPIVAYARESGSGTGSVFENGIFAQTGNRRSNAIPIVETNDEMASNVNSDPNAIGFVGYAFVRGAKPLNLAGECGLTARPDAFSAKAEEYPLQRRLYLYNRADTTTDVIQEFLDFTISAGADGVVAKSGFVDLGVLQVPQDNTNTGRIRDLIDNTVDPGEFGLMRELVVDLIQFDRLSTTFRFASGSSQLEAKALLDLQRLVDYLNEIDGNVEVSFVGFTDTDGSFGANQSLSVGRAQQVAQAVQQYAAGRLGQNIQFTARGYGELVPSACNTSLDGKRTNRRVEVWIRNAG